MNIVECIQHISEYLGCQPNDEVVVDPSKYKHYFFEASGLKYEVHIELEEQKLLAISGDFKLPFSSDSLFEVVAPFDRIAIETEPHCYGNQEILVLRKDYPGRPNFKTLMIIKWPNDKLSVWPSQCVLDVPIA